MYVRTPPSITEFRRLLRAGPCAEIQVSTEVPASIPATFVRLERIGGRPENMVTDAPRILVHVYATDGIVAEALALDIQDFLIAGRWRGTDTPSGHRRMGFTLESLMDLPDPDRPHLHRWQIIGLFRISRLTNQAPANS